MIINLMSSILLRDGKFTGGGSYFLFIVKKNPAPVFGEVKRSPENVPEQLRVRK